MRTLRTYQPDVDSSLSIGEEHGTLVGSCSECKSGESAFMGVSRCIAHAPCGLSQSAYRADSGLTMTLRTKGLCSTSQNDSATQPYLCVAVTRARGLIPRSVCTFR
jgi:hypothetical protein